MQWCSYLCKTACKCVIHLEKKLLNILTVKSSIKRTTTIVLPDYKLLNARNSGLLPYAWYKIYFRNGCPFLCKSTWWLIVKRINAIIKIINGTSAVKTNIAAAIMNQCKKANLPQFKVTMINLVTTAEDFPKKTCFNDVPKKM